MSDQDLNSLEQFFKNTDALINRLSPARIKKLTRELGNEMKRRNRQRIKANIQPDGMAFMKRKGTAWQTRALKDGEKLKPNQRFSYLGQHDLVLANVVDKGNRFIGRETTKGNYPYNSSGFLKKNIQLKGRIKQKKMFKKLPSGKYLQSKNNENKAMIGFMSGLVGYIAHAHHYGEDKRPERRLLGFAPDDLTMIQDKLLQALTED